MHSEAELRYGCLQPGRHLTQLQRSRLGYRWLLRRTLASPPSLPCLPLLRSSLKKLIPFTHRLAAVLQTHQFRGAFRIKHQQ
jgi:hypothetical protein